MAAAAVPLFGFDGGAVAASVVYDDQTLAVSGVVWQNMTGADVPVTLVPHHGRSRTVRLAAGGSGAVDVSRFGLSMALDADGQIVFGWGGSMSWRM